MAEKSKIDILIETAAAAKNVGQLRKAMKELVSAQESVDKSSPDFQKLVEGINETEGRIGELNDAFRTFQGSGVARLNASTALLGQSFRELDFGKLQTGLQGIKQLPKALSGEIDGLSKTIGKLNFGNLSSSMKELAGSGIGQLVKSLGTLAKAILTNPILLLAAVIIGIVVAMVQFYDKIKPLKAIVEAVSAAFGALVGVLKDVADWLGITSFAAEEAAQKQMDAAKKAEEATREKFDTEIKLAEAAGKRTIELERKKGEAVRENIRGQIEALAKLALINGSWTDEQLKQLQELKKAYKDSLIETKVADRKEAKRVADEEKKKLDERNKNYKDFVEKRRADNQKLTDQIDDQQIALIKNDEEREKAKALLDRERANDAINASKASNQLKNAALKSQEETYLKNIADINKKYRDKEAEEKKKALEEERALREKIAAENKAMEDAAITDLLNNLQLRIDAAKEGSERELKARLDLLEAQKQAEIMNYAEGSEERSLVEQSFQKQKDELITQFRDKQKQEDIDAANAAFDIAQKSANALTGLSDMVFAIKQANTKRGSAEEEKAARQQFKINKGLQIASAVISTIQGVLNALTAKSTLPEPFGQALRIATAVSVGAAGAASVAKIAATQFETKSAGGVPSGGGGGGGGTTAGGGAAPAQFSAPQFFGLGQGAGAGTPPPQRVYVLEKDITSTQDRVARVEDRATQKIE